MVYTHNLGFSRIGGKRELKFALENYWRGHSSSEELEKLGNDLRRRHWVLQSSLDLVPLGDFSFYDHMLDTSFLLGNIPVRAQGYSGSSLDNYFRLARGRSAPGLAEHQSCCGVSNQVDTGESSIAAGEMTKWFDTNYHYIVPELLAGTTFQLNAQPLLQQLREAREVGVHPKPVIVGPLTYLALGKAKDRSNKLGLLSRLVPVYKELLDAFAAQGIDWVQIDEPILVTDLTPEWQEGFKTTYEALQTDDVKLLLTTYFGDLQDNLSLVASLPVQGVHLDATLARHEIDALLAKLSPDCVLSLGVINGRNVWKTDLSSVLDWLQPLAHKLGDQLWIAPSCSLLHVPVDLEYEQRLDQEIVSWLAFAKQKLEELHILGRALTQGRETVETELAANRRAIQSRNSSKRVHNPAVRAELAQLQASASKRKSPYQKRAEKQAARLQLPRFPTTTIGSFPQTEDIRRARSHYKSGKIDQATYEDAMRREIQLCIHEQEALELDVFVHGEPERNDMVEYFGEQLEGYAFSQNGWVQSYGSRCVKPPILFGDIHRPKPMTVKWITYAQSLTTKTMKGMLTGPVTILNWSFVRDDQPRSITCKQIALAIRREVLDLEKAGIRIIQIDEAALREGLPLRRAQWKEYLSWALESFRIAGNGVKDETQIHTHMCYSEFNDIISDIAEMDADVITIETSRSDMELLDAFDDFKYPNEMGPGVYDIHSPNIPDEERIIDLIKKAAKRIPAERLWVNPDCGLKTRQWSEVRPALSHMVSAAKKLREADDSL